MLVTAGNADLIYMFVLLQAANVCMWACVRIMSYTDVTKASSVFAECEHIHGRHIALEVTTLLPVTRWQLMVIARVPRSQILLSLKQRDSQRRSESWFPQCNTQQAPNIKQRGKKENAKSTQSGCVFFRLLTRANSQAIDWTQVEDQSPTERQKVQKQSEREIEREWA